MTETTNNLTTIDCIKQAGTKPGLLIGYYGGGNYGDELLLEVLMNIFKQHNPNMPLTVTHQAPNDYDQYHHDFGYPRISMRSKLTLLRAILRSKNIFVGGGGLWGMDVNMNILLLSGMLFGSRLLGKRVYLLGVGYYGSTNRLGKVSAFFAGKSARHIVARDTETYQRFQALTNRVSQDSDIAFNIQQLDLSQYQDQADALATQLTLHPRMVYVTLRRFEDDRATPYHQLLAQCIQDHPEQQFVISLMQPPQDFPAGQELLNIWKEDYPNVQLLDTQTNPLALLAFFQTHAQRFIFITPQFHAIITAMLCNIPYLPMAYDNKVTELLDSHNMASTPFTAVTLEQLNQFIGYEAY